MEHADKWGALAAVAVALCLVEVPAATAAVGFVGLDFLLTTAFLIPLLALFLGAALWGLAMDRRRHRRRVPSRLAWPAAALALAGAAVSDVLLWAGLALLVAAAGWNWRLVRRSGRQRPIW